MENTEYLEELIDQFEKQLTNFAYTYVKDWSIAQDIVQDVFIKVYQHLHTFEGRSNIKTWLYSITANQSKDYLRSQKRKNLGLTGMLSSILIKEEKNPEIILAEKETNQTLAEKVLALPIKYREVIILFYYEDLSIAEISQLLKVNASTIRTRLDRARKILKETKGGSERYE